MLCKGEGPVLDASPRKTLYFTYLFIFDPEAAHSFMDWGLFFYLIIFLLLYYCHYHFVPLNLPSHPPPTTITTLKVLLKIQTGKDHSHITQVANPQVIIRKHLELENYGKGNKEGESSTLTPFIVIQLESVGTSAVIGPFGVNAASSLAHALVFQAFVNIYKSILKI